MSIVWVYRVVLLLSVNLSISGTQAQIAQSLSEIWDGTFEENQPGGALLLALDGNPIFERYYGLADMNTKKEIDSLTVFNTGSISKTMVAYAVLILAAEDKLSLDDPLIQYFPAFENRDLIHPVRIGHLLAHCSGLPDIRNVSNHRDFFLTAKDKENFAPLFKTQRLNFTPGSQFEYSNPAFNGLALIVEEVAGVPWQEFVQQRIFDPAKMVHSLITNGSYPSSGVAHAYIARGGQWIENDYGEVPTFAAAGNGGVWSTAKDLLQYQLSIQQYLFLSQNWIEQSQEVYHPPNWTSTQSPMLGMSWFIMEADHPNNSWGTKVVYHTGSQGGFRAFHYYLPEYDITFIGLFNRPIPNMIEKAYASLSALEQLNGLSK